MGGADTPASEIKLPRGLSTGLVLLLGSLVALMAATIAAFSNRIYVVQKFRSGQIVTAAQADSADDLVGTIATIEGWVWIAAFVLWILWQFRAQRAARELSPVDRFRFTPGWVIGWWFIPIANLWMPFETVRELWKSSEGRLDWPQMPTWSVIGWWWGLFLISIVTFNVASVAANEATTPEAVIRGDSFFIAALVLDIAASILAIAIVRSVRHRQDLAAGSHSLMREGAPPSVPPPPVPI